MEFGPNFIEGLGRTDGETLERLWSYLRPFSNITKQMVPEKPMDLLSDAMRHYARRKKRRICKHNILKSWLRDITFICFGGIVGAVDSALDS